MQHQSTKQYRAEVAHRIPDHPGECKFIHGHSYLFEITVTSDSPSVNDLGMVIDFKKFKQVIAQVIDPWDHSLVLVFNDPLIDLLVSVRGVRIVPVPFIPTAENMAAYIAYKINELLPRGICVEAVKVWETTTSYAEWKLSQC